MDKNRPLDGFRIINTRTRTQASELTGLLTDLGAEVKEMPAIEVIYVDERGNLGKEVKRIDRYDWIVFTSANAVKSFFNILKKLGMNINALNGCKIACIGKGTAKAVNYFSVDVNIISKRAVAESLVERLKESGPWIDKSVLIPCAEKTRDVILQSLKQWGADVTSSTAYHTVLPHSVDNSLLKLIIDRDYDIITFTSSSTCLNLVNIIGEHRFDSIKSNMKAASIGPVTTATMRKLGLNPVVEAKESSLPGLVESITEYLTGDCHPTRFIQ
ncbi:MAG: uroporphyrinogen-III synthase [Chitinispirillia bacterium]|jgi:uroporphyrinogen III methyltransferase/synthase